MIYLESIISFCNSIIWSDISLIIFVCIGLYFTIRLRFFQFTKIKEIWKNLFTSKASNKGISSFGAFCAAMAMRIGTGNIVGAAIAIFSGGPGVIFWFWVIGLLNAAISFVECSLSQLYKRSLDGEYRGSGAICAWFGLGQRWYGSIVAILLCIVASCFMPAAEANTIVSSFKSISPDAGFWMVLIAAIIFFIVVFGGIRSIGKFSSIFVVSKVILFFVSATLIIIWNINKVPEAFSLIFQSAFSLDKVLWGVFGTAMFQGFRRITFASASGMGEAMPAAASAEASHPCKQGFANSAGVLICTLGVCTFSGLAIVTSGCFYTSTGYIGSFGESICNVEPGIAFIQTALGQITGTIFSNYFFAFLMMLFSITAIIGYYYEAETSLLFIFLDDKYVKSRKFVSVILRLLMTFLIIFYGLLQYNLAWGISDLALGMCTAFNMIIVVLLSSKIFLLFDDYFQQIKTKPASLSWPKYDIDKIKIAGVDEAVWKSKIK